MLNKKNYMFIINILEDNHDLISVAQADGNFPRKALSAHSGRAGVGRRGGEGVGGWWVGGVDPDCVGWPLPRSFGVTLSWCPC